MSFAITCTTCTGSRTLSGEILSYREKGNEPAKLNHRFFHRNRKQTTPRKCGFIVLLRIKNMNTSFQITYSFRPRQSTHSSRSTPKSITVRAGAKSPHQAAEAAQWYLISPLQTSHLAHGRRPPNSTLLIRKFLKFSISTKRMNPSPVI